MRAAASTAAAQAARLAAREGAARPAAAVVTLVDESNARILGLARSEAPGIVPGRNLTQGQSSLAALAIARARETLREMSRKGLDKLCLTCTAEPSPEVVEMAMELGMEVATSDPIQDTDPAILVQAVVTDAAQENVLLYRHTSGPYMGRLTGFIVPVDRMEDATANAAREAALRAGVPLDASASDPELFGVMDFIEIHDEPALELEFLAVADIAAPTPPGLEWWPRREIPFHLMPDDDAWWYPQVLEKQTCRGHFIFDGKKLLHGHLH